MALKKQLSHLTEALLEIAADQNSCGLMDDASYRKIVARHLGLPAPESDRVDHPRILKATRSAGSGRRGNRALEALRGSADPRMTTHQIVTLTRGELGSRGGGK